MPFLAVAGSRLFWRDLGQGQVLVLIHGLGSSGADWAFQVPPLVDGYRLILPDLPGSGQSDPPRSGFSIAAMADALWQLLDAIDAAKPHVVGFSLGGAVALEMALQRPTQIDRLVLINSLPSYRVDHWKKWLELYAQMGLVRTLGLPRAARMVAARLFPLPHQAPMRSRVATVVGANPVRPYLATARALADWCAAERVEALRVPTLMIAGEFDYTPLAEKRMWSQRLRASLAVVRGSRHGTPFDATAATNACLAAFLDKRSLPSDEALVADTAETAPTQSPLVLN
ncbi:MAG: alpha/beta fold hydrolase [Pseudomarimonas sp.]